jgi:hypothetical protein
MRLKPLAVVFLLVFSAFASILIFPPQPAHAATDNSMFIAPYVTQEEDTRTWFMKPFPATNGSFGYDSTFGLIRGGYWNASSMAAVCSSCLSPPSQLQLDNAVNYFSAKYNSEVNQIAVGTQTTCGGPCGGVPFSYMDSTFALQHACPILPPFYRVLPNENWMDGAALQGMSKFPTIVTAVFSMIEAFKSSVGWRPADNRESMIGYPISYSKGNNNICFTLNHTSPLPTFGTHQYEVASAARWNFATQSFISWDSNINHALANNQIDEQLFQAVNLWIRNSPANAFQQLQGVANLCTVNGDGSVGFGVAPYRGMYLGSFLEAAEVIGTPTMPAGCSIGAVEATLWGIQQPDGGFARQYNEFCATIGSVCLGSDDETTNQALLGYSPGVIYRVQSIQASHIYNTSSIPNTNPVVNPNAIIPTTTNGGWHNGFVLIDDNLLPGKTLDYLNSLHSVTTNIENTTRNTWLTQSFTNPDTQALLLYNGQDRREALFGTIIDCIHGTPGTIGYASGHFFTDPVPITSEYPLGACKNPDAEPMIELAPQIDLFNKTGDAVNAVRLFWKTFHAWTPTAGTGLGGTTGGFFNSTLDTGTCHSTAALGYWIEMARATGFWNLNSTASDFAQQVVNQAWAEQAPDGGLYVDYQSCGSATTAESAVSSGIVLLAFDPRVPSWFAPTVGGGGGSGGGLGTFWTLQTPLPTAGVTQCFYSPTFQKDYCLQVSNGVGQTVTGMHGYYAVATSGTITSWSTTNAWPTGSIPGETGTVTSWDISPHCTSDGSFIYCFGGEPSGTGLSIQHVNTTFSAPMTNTGIGSWTFGAEMPFPGYTSGSPTPVLAAIGCVIYSASAYCVFANWRDDITHIREAVAPISGGVIGSWSETTLPTAFPNGGLGSQCQLTQTNLDVCIGRKALTQSPVNASTLSGSFGSWVGKTNYPANLGTDPRGGGAGLIYAGCDSNALAIYCVYGKSSALDSFTFTTDGAATWNISGPNYPLSFIADPGCALVGNNSFVCAGGFLWASNSATSSVYSIHALSPPSVSNISITVKSNPVDLPNSIIVDNITYLHNPQFFAWTPGSSHNLTAIRLMNVSGMQYGFGCWEVNDTYPGDCRTFDSAGTGSLVNGITELVTAPSFPTTYTAIYWRVDLTGNASIAVVGHAALLNATTNHDVGSTPYFIGIYNITGTNHTLIASIASGLSVSVSVFESTPHNETFLAEITNQPYGVNNVGGSIANSTTFEVDWVPRIITYTVQSDPLDLPNSITVDNVTYLDNPQFFNWAVGSTHNLTAAPLITVGSVQYGFGCWLVNGTLPDGIQTCRTFDAVGGIDLSNGVTYIITAPPFATTYTAEYWNVTLAANMTIRHVGGGVLLTAVTNRALVIGNVSGSSTLYGCTSNGASPSSLYTISTIDGSATLVGSMVNEFQCSGLAYDGGARLLSTGQDGAFGLGSLFTVDLNTGVATLIGNTFSPDDSAFITFSDIAFNSTGGAFVSGARPVPANASQAAIYADIGGTASRLGSLGQAAPFGQGEGLAFASNGSLYYTSGNGTTGQEFDHISSKFGGAFTILASGDLASTSVCSGGNAAPNGMTFNGGTPYAAITCGDGSSHLARFEFGNLTYSNIGTTVTNLTGLEFVQTPATSAPLYRIAIYNMTGTPVFLTDCSIGLTCSVVVSESTPHNDTFLAEVTAEPFGHVPGGSIANSTFAIVIWTNGNITVIIKTAPVDVLNALVIDGVVYPHNPQTFIWGAGTVHNITAMQIAGGAYPYHFVSWSDNGARSHLVTVPDVPIEVYVANYATGIVAQSCNEPTAILQLEAGCWLPAVVTWYSAPIGLALFLGIILGDIDMAIFLKTRNAVIAMIVFTVGVSVLGAALPGIFSELAYVVLALGVAGIVYKVYTLRS